MALRDFGFSAQLIMSQGHATNADVGKVLMQIIPGALNVHLAAKANDRMGVDWWVEMPNARHLAVDVKVRKEDWAAKPNPEDDLALETWSVVEAAKVGWTRDEQKRCDYVLWFWQDTRRYCLVPFPMLCRVMNTHWQSWSRQYKTARQRTTGAGGAYQSECVYVPRKTVWRAIYNQFGGVPPGP
jgi:hypothetical protein